MKNENADYESYNAGYGRRRERRCIDGSVTGCGKCIGYCRSEGHEGFLTEALRREHGCIAKGCNYYVPRLRAGRGGQSDWQAKVLAAGKMLFGKEKLK